MDDKFVLSARVERLVSDFERSCDTQPGFTESLRTAISGSPELANQLDSAISRGLLKRLAMLPSGSSASGEYHSQERLIKLNPGLASEPGVAAFILGHESQHALNSPTTLRSVAQFHRDVTRTAATNRDYTAAIRLLIDASRWDEASSTLAGWNALVGYVRSTRDHVHLTDIVRAAPSVAPDFVIRRGRKARYYSSLESAEDLTLPSTPENVEAIAQKYFDKTPTDTKLGARGTSDYANYYGAWAIGVITPSHNSRGRDQPMRIDLASLGLIRQIMEQNGIDLHGVQQQAYVDASTEPPTRDFFHHTMGTFRYVPPTATTVGRPNDHSTEQAFAALRLASLGFARPATGAIRTANSKPRSHHDRTAVAVRNARFVPGAQSNSVP